MCFTACRAKVELPPSSPANPTATLTTTTSIPCPLVHALCARMISLWILSPGSLTSPSLDFKTTTLCHRVVASVNFCH